MTLSFNRSSELINSCLFKDLSNEDKKTLLNLIIENRIKSSNRNKIPVTFITNEGLTAKLSLLLPALTVGTGIQMPMLLGLGQPERKILLHHLGLLKNFSLYQSAEKGKQRPLSNKATYISPPLKIEKIINKIMFNPEDADNNFIAAAVINLLLCHPEAVFFLLSFGKGRILENYETCHRSAVKLMEICNLIDVKGAYTMIHLDRSLGAALGSRLELKEVLDTSEGKGPYDLLKLAVEICAELMFITEIFSDKNRAKRHIKQQILNGKASDELERIWGLPRSAFLSFYLKSKPSASPIRSIHLMSHISGFIQPFSAAKIVKLQELFLKRRNIFGMFFNKKTGEKVTNGDKLATVFFSEESGLNNILEKIRPLFHIEMHIPDFCPLIIERGSTH